MAAVKYGRAVIKLSGAAFAGDAGPLDPARLAYVAAEVKAAVEAGAQVAIVPGGGNVVRGRAAREMGWPQVAADYMGMLATVVNGLALRESLAARGVAAEAMAAFGVGEGCGRYERRRARELLAAGTAVIVAGGTARPFFTTDTAAALRACELDADVILKATDVAGVYDRDPAVHADAAPFEKLTPAEIIEKKLEVMDAAAAALGRDHGIPIIVFSLYKAGNIVKILRGEKVGTYVG
jgi:uridylate kinase